MQSFIYRSAIQWIAERVHPSVQLASETSVHLLAHLSNKSVNDVCNDTLKERDRFPEVVAEIGLPNGALLTCSSVQSIHDKLTAAGCECKIATWPKVPRVYVNVVPGFGRGDFGFIQPATSAALLMQHLQGVQAMKAKVLELLTAP